MEGLTITVEFLTGRCVAAKVSDRDAAEWPPHFGRLFMALAAACFEMDEDEHEVAALKWLESLPAPAICGWSWPLAAPVAPANPITALSVR